MNQVGQEGLAVVDDGRLVGMVTRDSADMIRGRAAAQAASPA